MTDPKPFDSATPFMKFDAGKPRFGLLPPAALTAVVKVFTFGAKKYAAHNYLKSTTLGRYSDAALRHIFAWLGGEETDPESGEPHLAHAICCLLMLLELRSRGLGEDDRMPQTTVGQTWEDK